MSPRGIWFHEGIDPLPPCESDKLVDREALAMAGGNALLTEKRVLDIGPCYGLDARDFAPLAACYVVVDYDTLVLEWMTKIAPRAVRVEATARMLPFRSGSFDTVLDFGTLDNVGALVESYREACRVLKSGGTFVTTYGNALVLGRGDGVGEIYSDPTELSALLADCGLVVTHRGYENQPRAIMIGMKARRS